MSIEVDTAKRELVARVATLELLVADLVEMLWQLDPERMEQLGEDAAHDLEIQNARFMPAGAEHQRERLFSVLRDRQHKLSHRRRRTRPASHEAHP